LPVLPGKPPSDEQSVPNPGLYGRKRQSFAAVLPARCMTYNGNKMFKPFSPTSLLPGGHAQTVGGVYWPVGNIPYCAEQHIVELSDGDCIVLHDDLPAQWKPNDRSVLMIHGLTGCHLSSYMRRISHKLVQSNVRVFRMDLRGCGAGFELARLPYHAGRSADVAAALESITARCPSSPTTLVGFSLGGNLTLKLLGELGKSSVGSLDSAIAVNPPIDLLACSRRLRLKSNRLYDRRFARLLWNQIR